MEGTYIPPGALGKVWRIYQGVISMITLAGAIMSAVFLGAMFINVMAFHPGDNSEFSKRPFMTIIPSNRRITRCLRTRNFGCIKRFSQY